MTQYVKCSRCSSEILTETDFATDRHGNRFKSCNNCRAYFHQRKAENTEARLQQSRQHYQETREAKIEKVKQWKADHIDKLIDKITCGCGGKFQYRTKAEHERTKKHTTYIASLN